MTRIQALSFMLDNVPEDSQPMKDLHFFEENFHGIMPLEIVVDTGKKRGVMRSSTLEQIAHFEESLQEVDFISEPLSLADLVKASRQAFYNQEPDFYELPSNQDRGFVLRYLQGGGQDSTTRSILNSMVDSTGQRTRISMTVADVGSIRLDSVIEK
ncbi:MAG: hypothetical protein HC880_02680 [Bacteroidia bacterium]|nr:hypothetical protein [Bacteroidia bacterium]